MWSRLLDLWSIRCGPRVRAAVELARLTFRASLEHDVLTVAQGTAYAAMVSLFPALIVAAAVVALLPDTLPFRMQLGIFFGRILPSNVSPVLQTYFETTHQSPQTARALLSAGIVSLTGAAGMMATLMEGFRRAHDLPIVPGSFWSRRGRALALVPLSLLPMAAASALVVFGHFISVWLANHVSPAVRTPVYVLAFGLRWSVALAGSVGIIAVIYHLGTDLSTQAREHLQPGVKKSWMWEPWLALRNDWTWQRSLPGATLATLLWFFTTLLFGWYVTRFANYSRVYGSLGAAIALMFWLYIIALCVLVGSEFNAQIAAMRRNPVSLEPALCNDAQPAVASDR